MLKVKAVAATIALVLGASVSYAQSSQTPLPVFPSSESPGNIPFQQAQFQSNNQPPPYPIVPGHGAGAMYVACWADVPSHNTAYFSAPFAARGVGAVYSMRKQFRSFVTTHYGPVSKLQCTGKFGEAVVNELVEQWKDSARAAKNAIVDT